MDIVSYNLYDGVAVAGLFGTAQNATIKNLYLNGTIAIDTSTDSFDNKDLFVGGIVGKSFGVSILTCGVNLSNYKVTNKTSTASNNSVGGLVGEMSESKDTVYNAYYNGNITADTGANRAYAGGLVGKVNIGLVKNAYTNTSIKVTSDSADTRAGTLTGYLAANGTVTSSYFVSISAQITRNSKTTNNSYGIGNYGDGNYGTYTACGELQDYWNQGLSAMSGQTMITSGSLVKALNIMARSPDGAAHGCITWKEYTGKNGSFPIFCETDFDLWTDNGNYDISWFDPDTYDTTTDYTLSNAA